MAEQKVTFRGKIATGSEGTVIHVTHSKGDLGTKLTLSDDVSGHLAGLQGREIVVTDENGKEMKVVIDRIDGDDVEGHAMASDRNIKSDIVRVIWE